MRGLEYLLAVRLPRYGEQFSIIDAVCSAHRVGRRIERRTKVADPGESKNCADGPQVPLESSSGPLETFIDRTARENPSAHDRERRRNQLRPSLDHPLHWLVDAKFSAFRRLGAGIDPHQDTPERNLIAEFSVVDCCNPSCAVPQLW